MTLTSFSNETTLIRKLFFEAAKSKEKTDIMYYFLQKKNYEQDPLIKGYYGMTHMLLAKHGFNIFTRYSNFNKGKELLEQAIADDSKNIELRFLRLSVQVNIPVFLNYSSNLEDDKKLISENYNKLTDSDLKTRIKDFYTSKNLKL